MTSQEASSDVEQIAIEVEPEHVTELRQSYDKAPVGEGLLLQMRKAVSWDGLHPC